MKKIHFILFTLLIICSCGLISKSKGNKENLETQAATQKTPEEALREHLSETQNKGLDFLKEVLKGNNYQLNRILSVDEDKLNKLKVVLDHIQISLENCHDSQAAHHGHTINGQEGLHDGHDDNAQKAAFKRLMLHYIEDQLESKEDNSNNRIILPLDFNPLKGSCVK
ncbi:hypothetical protein bcCo53_000003 [Borrelia coriaceae]|uniref:Mlp family lipoprotein n=1 Tax=Borrelia coriaceae TaxID=144 RepID=UPI001FF1B55E|nr:Mlp family lipoprotein [Borrelia coriaceae]UPA15884.1 hypothetical protein bcCo53_000003 [Borrelia coriaceae]